MKFILRLLLLLLLALPAWCATSTLTGTFVDASGNPVNGYLILQLPVPAVDTATGNSIAVTPVRYRVVNGIVQSGPPVYDVAGLQPQNLYYITSLYDNSGTRIFTANYFVTGTPFNLSAAIPTNITTSNISFAAGNLVNVGGTNAFTGTNTFSGPTTMTGAFSTAALNSIIYVDGVKYTTLASALAACGTVNCWVIDTFPETFSTNPFASFTGANGCKVDFAAGMWTVNAQIIVPIKCTMTGAGRASTAFNAGGSFPASTAMFRLGAGATFEAGIRLENLAINCANIPGSQGVYSNSINEQSGLFRVLIQNCASHSVLIDMAGGASNFAINFSMNELEIYPNSTSAAVHGIYIRGGNGNFAGANFKTLSNITVNNTGASAAGDGIRIEDVTGGDIIGLHCEQLTNCAHISSTGAGLFTDNIRISDVTHGRGGTQVILIDAGSNHIDLRNIVRQNGTAATATIQDNASSPTVTVAGSSILSGTLFTTGYYHLGSTILNGAITSNASQRATVQLADQGTVCTNGELALSAGWQSTGSATVTAVAGNGQTCSWTITTGTTTAANPTVTDTLTNVLPAATTVCEMNIHGGTHTAAAGEGFQQTTLSATAPVFTFNGTPTAGGTTYFVTRRCGP